MTKNLYCRKKLLHACDICSSTLTNQLYYTCPCNHRIHTKCISNTYFEILCPNCRNRVGIDDNYCGQCGNCIRSSSQNKFNRSFKKRLTLYGICNLCNLRSELVNN